MQAVTCNATESLEEVIVLFVIIELKLTKRAVWSSKTPPSASISQQLCGGLQVGGHVSGQVGEFCFLEDPPFWVPICLAVNGINVSHNL